MLLAVYMFRLAVLFIITIHNQYNRCYSDGEMVRKISFERWKQSSLTVLRLGNVTSWQLSSRGACLGQVGWTSWAGWAITEQICGNDA